jgi:uncharacterized membrane protein
MTAARTRPRVSRARAWSVPGRPDLVLWATVAAVFAAYTAISVSRYVQDNPASWDLGIFVEAVRQYAHLHAPVVAIRGAGFDLRGDHFHPALALLGPVFAVVATPVTLLVAQAALTAASVIPVTRAAVALLGAASGRLIGAAYGFSWGLASMNWYDFHEVAIAVPLLAGSLSALARRKMAAAALWALPLVFVKEDQGCTVAAVGLVMMFAYRPVPRWTRITGALLAGWGLAWSFAAIYLIIPMFNASHQYPYWNKGAHLAGIAGSLAAGAAVKLPTLALLLVPTVAVALRSPLVIVAVPGLALRFVSPDTSYWGTSWHYNATAMPVMFVAAVDGLARIRAARAARAAGPATAGEPGGESGVMGGSAGSLAGPAAGPMPARAAVWSADGGQDRVAGGVAGWLTAQARVLGGLFERHAAAMMGAVAIAVAFQSPLHDLWSPQTYQVSRHARVADAAMRLVPAGSTVEASLDELAPLAARDDTYWVGNRNPPPAWVVFDQQSPEWSISDVPTFINARHAGVSYRVVSEQDGVWVMRRN